MLHAERTPRTAHHALRIPVLSFVGAASWSLPLSVRFASTLYSPVCDEFIAGGRAGGAQVEEGLVVRSRALIGILAAPGILGDAVALEVRPVPALGVARWRDQIHQRLGKMT